MATSFAASSTMSSRSAAGLARSPTSTWRHGSIPISRHLAVAHPLLRSEVRAGSAADALVLAVADLRDRLSPPAADSDARPAPPRGRQRSDQLSAAATKRYSFSRPATSLATRGRAEPPPPPPMASAPLIASASAPPPPDPRAVSWPPVTPLARASLASRASVVTDHLFLVETRAHGVELLRLTQSAL